MSESVKQIESLIGLVLSEVEVSLFKTLILLGKVEPAGEAGPASGSKQFDGAQRGQVAPPGLDQQ